MIPKLVLIPLITGMVVQASKLIWHAAALRPLTWRALDLYGGMPSAHTAIAVSLVTVLGLGPGVASPSFAVAAILAALVIRDAIGFRRDLGGHGRALNRIVHGEQQELVEPKILFREHIGHTPLEAFVGAVLGFCCSVVFYLLIP